MAAISMTSEIQANGVLSQVEKEFVALNSEVLRLKEEKAELKEKLRKAEAKAEELKPELFAKYVEESKSALAQEQALKVRRPALVEELQKFKTAYHEAESKLAALDQEVSKLHSQSETGAALLYAKVDLYTNDLKNQSEKALNAAKSEKSLAETQRQAAQDLVKKAEEQLAKIQTHGKSVLDQVAKEEANLKLKVDIHKDELKKMDAEKVKLEKQIKYLADLYEQRKKLEEGLRK